MRKLLLITGDLATGKSTFAHILSKRYDTCLLVKDTVKEVLGDVLGASTNEESKRLSLAAVEVMLYTFSSFTSLNKDLILEANFHADELLKIQKMASESDYQVLTLVIRADLETLHKRYLNRMHNEDRHPVHLSGMFEAFDDFKAYIERSREESVPGDTIYIDANDFSYQIDEELLKKIENFLMS